MYTYFFCFSKCILRLSSWLLLSNLSLYWDIRGCSAAILLGALVTLKAPEKAAARSSMVDKLAGECLFCEISHLCVALKNIENKSLINILKMPDMKIFKINLAKTCRLGEFSSKYMSHPQSQTCISFRSKQEKIVLMLFIVLFSMVTTFSKHHYHWFLLKVFGILMCTKFHQKSLKNMTITFGRLTKIRVALKKNWGDDVVNHVRHL